MTPVTPFDVFFVIVAAALGVAVGLVVLAVTVSLLYVVGSVTIMRLVRRTTP